MPEHARQTIQQLAKLDGICALDSRMIELDRLSSLMWILISISYCLVKRVLRAFTQTGETAQTGETGETTQTIA